MLRKDSINNSRQRVHCILHYASYQTFPVVKSSYRESTYQASWKMPGIGKNRLFTVLDLFHESEIMRNPSLEM